MAVAPEKKKKVLPIFFMIDASGSMKGTRISAVNTAMRDVVSEIRKIGEREITVEFQVRVMTYSYYGIQWKQGSREFGVPLDKYNWIDITDSECEGFTPMGECIEEVADMCSDVNWQSCIGKSISKPFMLLISDGDANGKVEVGNACRKLFDSKVGQNSVCVSIGIDIDDNEEAIQNLEDFGKSGMVRADDADPMKLAELIAKITTSSLLTTSSVEISSTSTDDINKERINMIVDDIL